MRAHHHQAELTGFVDGGRTWLRPRPYFFSLQAREKKSHARNASVLPRVGVKPKGSLGRVRWSVRPTSHTRWPRHTQLEAQQQQASFSPLLDPQTWRPASASAAVSAPADVTFLSVPSSDVRLSLTFPRPLALLYVLAGVPEVLRECRHDVGVHCAKGRLHGVPAPHQGGEPLSLSHLPSEKRKREGVGRRWRERESDS